MLNTALAYTRRGWFVFPIWGTASCAAGECSLGEACKHPGKHPILPKGHQGSSLDGDQVTSWWTAHPTANIGIDLERSGLVALDVDVSKGKPGAASLEELDADLPETLIAVTGSGGLHLVYARTADAQARRKIGFRPGLDLLGKGYILAAPSNHESGGTYRWIDEAAPIAPLPAVLASVFTATDTTKVEWEHDPSAEPASTTLLDDARARLKRHGPAIAGQGGDQHTFDAGAILLNDYGLTPAEAWPLALEWNATCQPPWTEVDLAEKLQNGERYAQGPRGIERAYDALGASPVFRPAEPAAVDTWEWHLQEARAAIAEALTRGEKRETPVPMFESLEALAARPFPPTPWLIDRLATTEGLGVISAEPKSAKSWAAIEMAVSVVTGTPCFGQYAITEPGPAAYFFAEDMAPSVASRSLALAKNRGLDAEALAHFYVQPRGRHLNLLDDESLAILLASARSLPQLKLLVIDPLRDVHDGEEDKSDSMAPVMKRLRFLAMTLKCAVIFVHHAKKTAEGAATGKRGGQKMRGSSVLHGAVDFALYLDGLTGNGVTEFSNTAEVEIKAARGAGTFGLTLEIEDGSGGTAQLATWHIESTEEQRARRNQEKDEQWLQNVIEACRTQDLASPYEISRVPSCRRDSGGEKGIADKIRALEGTHIWKHQVKRAGELVTVYRPFPENHTPAPVVANAPATGFLRNTPTGKDVPSS